MLLKVAVTQCCGNTISQWRQICFLQFSVRLPHMLIIHPLFFLRMGNKRKIPMTRIETAKKFCGAPSELHETEPPLIKHVIQYSYYLRNTSTDKADNSISKDIALKVIGIWNKVDPLLPLQNLKTVTTRIQRLCFIKAKENERNRMKPDVRRNWEASVDKLFDICLCV